jgi:hypothetical protein
MDALTDADRAAVKVATKAAKQTSTTSTMSTTDWPGYRRATSSSLTVHSFFAVSRSLPSARSAATLQSAK